MFTGIIKAQSKVEIVSKNELDITIKVNLKDLKDDFKIGDSIAINGVCLTIAKLEGSDAYFDLMKETLDKTDFGTVQNGDFLNLEPAMKLSDKLDGHIVYGDVDSIGKIIDIKEVGNSKVYTFEYPKEYAMYFIDKGRITVDGASLTVINSKVDGVFSVSLIPHSLKELNISNKNIGDSVNLEYDVYAKLIFKQRRFHD